MKIDVALMPALHEKPEASVCVVVDQLRATSVIATLFARGVAEVLVSGTIDDARALHTALPGALLCGEAGGLPPEGFDYGNSPVEFDALDLAGRRVVLATSNGTRALVHAAAAPAVFTGSLANLDAACRTAVAEAQRWGLDLTFLCSGTDLGRAFSLEDTGACGAMVERVVSTCTGPTDDVMLTDSAMAAYRLWRSYSAPRTLMGESVHGQALTRLGLAADLDFCSRIDLYEVAPRLHRADDGTLVLTRPT